MRLPDSPGLLAGIVHLRNEFLAVLGLDDLAGEPAGASPADRQLLVLTGPGVPWAILVDEVAAPAPLELAVDTAVRHPDTWAAVVLGSATYRERVVRVLDPNRLHRLAEQQLSREWTPFSAACDTVATSRTLVGTTIAQGVED